MYPTVYRSGNAIMPVFVQILHVAFVSAVLLLLSSRPVKAMYCEIGQEPDRDAHRYRWVIPVEEPCRCTQVRVGSLNTLAPYRPFKVTYYDTFLHSNDSEEIQTWLNCSETPPPCAMGTKQTPAVSCAQILQACDRPISGMYYLQNASMKHAVHCDMPGGWARFGKGNMQSHWNYTDEDFVEVDLSIISDEEIEVMKEFSFTDFKIRTDVTFYLQADDSTNPSTMEVMYLPSLEAANLSIGHGRDHTNLKFNNEGDRLVCRDGGGSDSCGTKGLPSVGQSSARLAITSLFFGPRVIELGAWVKENMWQRNRYTWYGSFYYILAK